MVSIEELEQRICRLEQQVASLSAVCSIPKEERQESRLTPKDIGGRIALQMHRHQITQKELGEALGTNQSYVSNIIHGKRTISIEKLTKIAEILSVSCDYLLNGIER